MKRGFTLLEFVVVVAIIAVASAILWPTCIGSSRHNARRSGCQSNLKQIALAFGQYAQDYDRQFPIVQSSSTVGWADLLQPYAQSWSIFQCPENGKRRDTNLTDYFYNARLSKVSAKNLSVLSNTIIAGDGLLESASNTAISELPKEWRSDEKSPAFRHLDGGNYAFADGHVKWLREHNVTLGISSRWTVEETNRPISCQSNLNQIVMGFKHYIQDNDSRFPPVQTAPKNGWSDALQLYLKDVYVFQCPSNDKIDKSKSIDYFYNARLAEVGYRSILLPESTVLAGDGQFNSATNTTLLALPESWRNSKKSPAHRHRGGANYIFADGHGGWVNQERIALGKPKKGKIYTFLVR